MTSTFRLPAIFVSYIRRWNCNWNTCSEWTMDCWKLFLSEVPVYMSTCTGTQVSIYLQPEPVSVLSRIWIVIIMFTLRVNISDKCKGTWWMYINVFFPLCWIYRRLFSLFSYVIIISIDKVPSIWWKWQANWLCLY